MTATRAILAGLGALGLAAAGWFAFRSLSNRPHETVARGTCAVAFESQLTPRIDPVEMHLLAIGDELHEIAMNGCKLSLRFDPVPGLKNPRYRILPESECDLNLPTHGQRRMRIGELSTLNGKPRPLYEQPHVEIMDREVRIVFDVADPEGPIWFKCHGVR